MEVSSDVLFYWVKKQWQNARIIKSNTPYDAGVSRAMFWSSASNMRGHLVVIDRKRMLHIDRHYANVVFLCLNAHPDDVLEMRNDTILLSGTDSVEAVFNHLGTIFDRFTEWENSLETALNTFLSYDAIIRSCDHLIEDPMALLDADFRYVSYSKRLAVESGFEDLYVDHSNQMTLEAINTLTAASDFIALEEKRDVFEYVANERMLHLNIFLHDEYVGRLAIPHKPCDYENEYYAEVLRIVARYVEDLYDRLGTFFKRSMAHESFRQLLVDFLEGKQPSRTALSLQLDRMHYRDDDEYALVQIRAQNPGGEYRFTSVLASHLESLLPRSVCFMVEERCYLLANITQYQEQTNRAFAHELALFLRESLTKASASRAFNDFFDLPFAYKQTDVAFEYGQQHDPMYWYYRFDNYALRFLLECGFRGFMPKHVCAQPILILERYDSRNSTQLNHTLETYIDTQYNAVATAEKLCVARSTFLKRIARIQEITGIDLDNAETLFYLSLSYRIIRESAR